MLRLCLLLLCRVCLAFALSPVTAPFVSPATGLPNQFFTWKSEQQIRYQCAGPEQGKPVILVHGLFVNSDHWRKTLESLSNAGYRTYALDLWGCGYSSKPSALSDIAQSVNGESRFEDNGIPDIISGVELGTANGGSVTRTRDIELRHPLRSPYNFYTWAELLNDFCEEVVLKTSKHPQATLVCNSIGTISSLQALLDADNLYNGVFVVCPNFRELHSAEIPFPSVSMPVVRQVQRLLRKYGQTAFDALAKPATVKEILREPYARTEAVDDTLVKVLLDPLLTPGASQVVFDTLSYSAGPLPEQQLAELSKRYSDSNDDSSKKPVWVCYGTADPWTPPKRVEALQARYSVVERVDALSNIGHCPHDEAPELVNPLLLQFLQDRLE